MPAQRIVVIGASAGGIEALKLVVSGLPDPFNAPICVVMHTAPESPGILHQILERAGRLPASLPTDGRRLQPGHIYVAPPDRHLLVEPGRVRVTRGPKENRFRPAIDPLFRSAAQVFGPAAIGVILTGNLDDGAAGLWAIKQLGGAAIVQDPADAQFPSMPRHALEASQVDYCVPAARIAPLLVALTATSTPEVQTARMREVIDIEVDIAKEQNAVDAGVEQLGRPSLFACPECHGVLRELKEDGRRRFRCHTGHAYSSGTLLAAVNEGIEASLWAAIRSLEEGYLLLQELARDDDRQPDGDRGRELEDRAAEVHRHARALRELVLRRSDVADPAEIARKE